MIPRPTKHPHPSSRSPRSPGAAYVPVVAPGASSQADIAHTAASAWFRLVLTPLLRRGASAARPVPAHVAVTGRACLRSVSVLAHDRSRRRTDRPCGPRSSAWSTSPPQCSRSHICGRAGPPWPAHAPQPVPQRRRLSGRCARPRPRQSPARPSWPRGAASSHPPRPAAAIQAAQRRPSPRVGGVRPSGVQQRARSAGRPCPAIARQAGPLPSVATARPGRPAAGHIGQTPGPPLHPLRHDGCRASGPSSERAWETSRRPRREGDPLQRARPGGVAGGTAGRAEGRSPPRTYLRY